MMVRVQEYTTFDEWIPEEDPYVACLKIGVQVEAHMREWGGYEEVPKNFRFENLRPVLKNMWEFSRLDRDMLLEMSEKMYGPDEAAEQVAIFDMFADWVEMCCEGSTPVASMYWLTLSRILKAEYEGGEWLAETLFPLNLFMDDKLYIFSVATHADSEYIWERHLDDIHEAMAHCSFLLADMRIEIWGGSGDEPLAIWSEAEEAA